MDTELLRPDRIRRFTRAEYDRLVSFGMFDGQKVELLDGVIVTMSPQGPEHYDAIAFVAARLGDAVAALGNVRIQAPLWLSDVDEPEPDIAVVAPGRNRHEHPRTAFLVVEVGISSVRDDRRFKGELYARANIPEYWLVDVPNERIERYRDPLEARYTRVDLVDLALPVALAALPEVQVELGGLF